LSLTHYVTHIHDESMFNLIFGPCAVCFVHSQMFYLPFINQIQYK